MLLDLHTLLTVTLCIAWLLGLMLLALWWQERSIVALAWWGSGYLAAGLAIVLFDLLPSEWTPGRAPVGAVLIVAAALMWTGTRVFQGRPASAGGVIAPAAAWAVISASPVPTDAPTETALILLCVAGYALMTALDLQRDRRRPPSPRWRVQAIAWTQGLACLLLSALVGFWRPEAFPGAWVGLSVLAIPLYVIATAFVIVVIVKRRLVLIHKTAAMTDPLTGLFNRRAFFETAAAMMATRAKAKAPVSLIAFDLDHFKSINDRFGHAAGDEALRVFAAAAVATLRATDVIGRIGGEEFVALIPGSVEEGAIAAERVRAAFQGVGQTIAAHEMAATVSIGVASGVPPLAIATLMERADAALYRAKSQGRNRVECAADTASPVAAEPSAAVLPAASLRPAC